MIFIKKIKDFFSCFLYIGIIFLCQKIVAILYSYVTFRLAVPGSFLEKKYPSGYITLEEKALKWIEETQNLPIFFGWVLGIFLIFLAYKLTKQKALLTARKKVDFYNLLLSIIIGIGTVLLVNGIIYAVKFFFGWELSPFQEESRGLQLYLNLFIIGLFIPSVEEVLFRGFILSKLMENGSYVYSVLVQAILFAISHMDIYQGISGVILGVVTGMVVVKTKSIWGAIFIHMLFNLMNQYLYQTDWVVDQLGQFLTFIALGVILNHMGLIRLKGMPSNTVIKSLHNGSQ